jgi:hypothetical protein
MILSVLGHLPAPQALCPACGEPNRCGFDPSSPETSDCWCLGVKIGSEKLERLHRNFGSSACLCPTCLEAAAGDPADPALPGRDYYVTPSGTLVFTAAYHVRRGHCCDNGCRHCPYGKPS